MQICKTCFDGEIYIAVKVTQSFKERNRGLLALAPLKADEGLLITPCRSVHTFGMNYALDLVYLDKALKIVKIVENLVPQRMSLALFAYSTLELKEGEVQRLGLRLNMQVTDQKYL